VKKQILAAITEYISRQERRSNPQGSFGNHKRWHPSVQETCECCESVRSPSRAFPYSLMLHCRTAKHVANLYGVDEKELRREARFVKVLAE